MTNILTNETASAYVVSTIGAWGDEYANIAVTNAVAVNLYEAEDDAIDVSFTYGAGLTGLMTVWVETTGELYGEW